MSSEVAHRSSATTGTSSAVRRGPFPYGLEANRRPVDAFLRFAFGQGVVGRRMEVEELFAEETHSVFTL